MWPLLRKITESDNLILVLTFVFVLIVVVSLVAATTILIVKFLNTPQGIDKLVEVFDRQHNGVSPTANVFSDFKEPSPIVLLQVDEEHFPISDDLLGEQRLVVLIGAIRIFKHSVCDIAIATDVNRERMSGRSVLGKH